MRQATTFKVGDKVRWKVSEECPFVCSGCGGSLHTHTASLVPYGMVRKVQRLTPTIMDHRPRCETLTLDDGGHFVFVAYPIEADFLVPDAIGGWFTPEELELVE